MDVDAVLAAHDQQVRRDLTTAPGFRAEAVGRVVRVTAPAGSSSSFIEWSGLDAASADAEIAAQVAYFTRLAQPFEWKTYGRDGPADLGTHLTRAGFAAGDPEAFMVGELEAVLAATAGHSDVAGVEIRPATRADVAGMRALSQVVWEVDASAMLNELFTEQEHDPNALQLLVALARGVVVSFGWIRLPANDFASLWGGTTHPEHRGRGIYRALVRRRAELSAAHGHRYLQVDCTPASGPILERLGLRTLDITTPYRWRPPPAA